MATLAIAASALGVAHDAQAQDVTESRLVSSIRVTVRFDSGSYALDEGAGTTAGQINLIARTRANTVPPLRGFSVAVLTRDGTAESTDDYQRVSRRVRFGGPFGGNWVAAGNAYESRVRVPVRIAQDDLVEGDERFRLLLQLPGRQPTVAVVPADLAAPRCTADGCQSSVTIVDDDSLDATLSYSGEVTITARHDTALQGIDPLEFVVTRSEAADQPLDVDVTLSSGIISARKLRYTATIAAGEATGALTVPTDDPAPGAVTGDVTATVDASKLYDVGDPSSASARLHVGDPLVTVSFSEGSYSVSESVGVLAARVRARTAANVPPPNNPISAAVSFRSGTATSPEDYSASFLLLSLPASSWVAEGDGYESDRTVPLSIVDDSKVEDDETLTMELAKPPTLSATVAFVGADARECMDSCTATVTIMDDDEDPTLDDQVVHSGTVSIDAVHPTALQGIDDLVFTVTRAVSLDSDLEVPVTLSSGIIDSDRLSHTVTVGANETSAELRVHTRTLDPAAATGDVIATVDDGEQYDIPDPPTASVRVYVGDPLVTVRLNAGSYTVDEAVGTTGELIRLVARTEPDIPAPTGAVHVALSTRSGTAASPHDYGVLSQEVAFEGESGGAWVAVDDAYQSEVAVSLTVVDDDAAEGAETLRLLLERTPGLPATVDLAPADLSMPTCMHDDDCAAIVTITDNDGQGVTVSETGTLSVDEGATAAYTVVLDTEPTDDVTVTLQVRDASDAEISVSEALTFTMDDWHIPQTVIVTAAADDNRAHGSATISHTVAGGDYEAKGVTAEPVEVAEVDAEGRTVVTLVHVPDGTVIPDNSTLTVGETVLDGTTFPEDGRVLYRLVFSAADGGRARYGADVELSFFWNHESPIVPVSGQLSRIVLSLPRADVWDSAARILDNEVGNPDSTVTVRITGCERHGCVIGTPNEITVTIADDDGGPAVAPPGRPASPAVLCPGRGHSSSDTGLKVIWEAPEFEGGAPVESYEVRYRQRQFVDSVVAPGEWQPWPDSVDATTVTITGLEAGTSYGVQVRAVNANGPGEWSPQGIGFTGQPDYICDSLDELHAG